MSWLVVIVLYEMQPIESAALRSLLATSRGLDDTPGISILLYDNTPGGCDPGPLPAGVRYEAAQQNDGLAPAYNRALAFAQQEGCTWLLILDQDTDLPSDFILRMSKLALEADQDRQIAAIVPRMIDAGRSVSPVFVRFWGTSYAAANWEGTSAREVHATNSATLFRVSALQHLGGFTPYFWLDYLDGYIFHQIYAHGLRVYIARDIKVEHKLSLLHGGELSPGRFQNVLWAESAYWDLYGSRTQRLALSGRLMGRVWRQWRRGHNAAIIKLTWKELTRRMLQSRARRISEWKRNMEQRMLSSGRADKDRQYSWRPSVSVCLAAYNGARYIEAQLHSILDQLEPTDEVIVVDDASTDATRERVGSLNDPRVRLIEHRNNMGALRSFEDAIRSASGEILFLSDQDDLWKPGKVSTVLWAFHLSPEANVAVSDADLIDERDNQLGPSYYAKRGRFRSSLLANIVRCSYLGCTMAFRSRIRASVLPFPAHADVLHDLWIGAVSAITGSKTTYIDHALVSYRRHEENLTGNRKLPLARQIRIRWDLCRSLVHFYRNRHDMKTSSVG